MDREKLKTVAGCYFKSVIGIEPDALTFAYEDHDIQEYTLDAALGGRRRFKIWMCPGHNLIELTEDHHRGTFTDAAALAGLNGSLGDLPSEHMKREKIIRSILDMHERVTSDKEYRVLLMSREKLEAHLPKQPTTALESVECFYRSLGPEQ